MSANISALLYLAAGVLFILALKGLSSPATSRAGNRNGMLGMLIAVVTTLWVAGVSDVLTWGLVIGGIAIGGAIGAVMAKRIAMTAMPQLVAFFHSLVGLAAVLTAAAALYSPEAFGIGVEGAIRAQSLVEMSLGVAIGAITFSGSVIAFLKLNGNMSGAPIILPARHLLNLLIFGVIIALVVYFALYQPHWAFWTITGLSFLFGVTLIVPIGGAEDREVRRSILKRFVQLCGGRNARIVVIPTASRLAETGSRYEDLFDRLETGSVETVDFEAREDGERPEFLDAIRAATGIFITGGNQLRLSTILGGTSAARLIRERNADGVPVGGTSAGASILSEHMIAYGEDGGSPHAGSVHLAPGFGLTNRFIIDQHFRQRDRLGRLVAALAYNPFAIGIGLDEDTAAFIGPDNTLEVEGSGAITVVDAGKLQFSSMAQAHADDPVCVIGLTVHVLTAGATFNLHTRQASPGTLAAPKAAAGA